MAAPNRGRRQLLIVVGAVATGYSLSLIARTFLSGVDAGTARALGQIVILLGLAAVALRGFRWARACLVIWLVYLTLSFGMATLLLMALSTIIGIVWLGFTAGVAYGAYVLFMSHDVEAFLTAQRPRNPTASRPSG